MIALQLTDTKDFMNKLLRTPCFDHFLLREGTIQTAANYRIDGSMPREFYTLEEMRELGIEGFPFLPFSLLRGTVFDLMKGKKLPVSFSLVFQLSQENMENTIRAADTIFTAQDVTAMMMNVRFQGGKLSLTTGVAYQTFSLDKSLEKAWDKMVQIFLNRHEIAFSIS